MLPLDCSSECRQSERTSLILRAFSDSAVATIHFGFRLLLQRPPGGCKTPLLLSSQIRAVQMFFMRLQAQITSNRGEWEVQFAIGEEDKQAYIWKNVEWCIK